MRPGLTGRAGASAAGLLIAVLLPSLPLRGQTVIQRYPAGTDADGARLTVVLKRYPKRPPNDKLCVPNRQYVLEKSRGGAVVTSEPVVTLCQTEDEAEITVDVGPNSIAVDRNGGAHGGYNLRQTFQLSPWRGIAVDDCSFYPSAEFTDERWDLRKLRAQAWYQPSPFENYPDDLGICDPSPKLFSYLIVPSVPVDTHRLEQSRGRLGSCALSLDASGNNGFVIWGKPDPGDPVEVKVLQTGERTLLAQVVDPRRSTAAATSWINADHFEVWMGSNSATLDPDQRWQFGIPVDEGAVQVGYGEPTRLPVVHRWKSALPDGRAAILLNIELPPRPHDYSNGLTVIYSQSLEGRAQKRLISHQPGQA